MKPLPLYIGGLSLLLTGCVFLYTGQANGGVVFGVGGLVLFWIGVAQKEEK